MERLNVKENVKCGLIGCHKETDIIPVTGIIQATCYRGKNIIWQDNSKNLVVNTGKNYLLNAGFASVTPFTDWYIGLINNTPAPTLAVTNTMSTGTRNWDELHSQYDETNRPTWVTGSTSSQTMTNATTADFTFNGSVTVYGLFITSDDTKNGTSGTMWSAGAFSSPRSVINGDVLKITYTAAM